MEGHGFDQAKLQKNLDQLFKNWVENGQLPCVQAVVMRRGETAYNNAFGWADMESKKPIANDSIFRIYSMTKVFTSVAMMMLHEEGRFKMHDPLSKYIPEYKDTKVAESDAAGHVSLVKPRREITIRDLFTMASGIPYPGGDTPAEKACGDTWRRFQTDAKKGNLWDTLRFAREVAKNPLSFHPGEHWWYGMSIDILGALVEVLSGEKLSVFMKKRIFDPLDLKDTGFFIPESEQHRFVTMYAADKKGQFKPAQNDPGEYLKPFPYESGGGGLVSTARDVSRFAQMLLGKGQFENVRLLSRKSVELMSRNHLSEQQLKDYNWNTQRGYGYGLAVRVMMHPEIAGYGSVGEFAWDGLAGTWFAVDPSEDMIAVFLIQTNPGNHYDFVPYFAQTVYGAIAD